MMSGRNEQIVAQEDFENDLWVPSHHRSIENALIMLYEGGKVNALAISLCIVQLNLYLEHFIQRVGYLLVHAYCKI